MAKQLLKITNQIPTPFLIIEEKVLRRNIGRIHDYANSHGFAVRPHIKTHKSLHIANIQLDSGAVGLTVAKVQISLCVNLFDHFYLITARGDVQKTAVDARGCLA